jgi:hypothetical protein
MNLMESTVVESSGTTNLIFVDYSDGEDLAYSFASNDDAEIFKTMEEMQLENSIYSGQQAVKPSSHTVDNVVPAGFLAKFKSIFDEDIDDEEFMDYYFKMVEMLEPYATKLSDLEEGKIEEASSIHGMDTDAVLDTIFEYGMKYGIAMKSHNQTQANDMSRKSKELIKQAVSIIGERLPMKHSPITMLDSVEESRNGNAQQKGIHFDGKPASKNSGDMDQSSPKSKSSGGSTPLAQQKSGTNVGKKKA